MELGMIGLGRMGASMVRRLLRAGHPCVVYDLEPRAVEALVEEGATGTTSLEDMTHKLSKPRAIWMMVPAGVVNPTLDALVPLLARDDVIVDGGNSYYHDDIRRAAELEPAGIHYVDVGTSGGVWGLDRGYCLMIGGAAAAVRRLEPVFAALAPSPESAPRTPGRETRAAPGGGYLHCGPSGAGHFVKMVHNGIEYGLMAAYAEGLNILHHANAGREKRAVDAETTPLRHPEHYAFDLDLADIAELWRRGSVISSWLLDLAARALLESPDLGKFAGRVSDSGEGRWTIAAAVDEAVPAPVLSAALYERFGSRGESDFADRMLSALRYEFGGHHGEATRHERRRLMAPTRSDALVLFGVTGDLAHKMIFPALYAMEKRGVLKVPVIGVAFPEWSLARLRKRVKDSIKRSGGIDSPRALQHLLSRLRYVSGDYNDPGTFTAIEKALAGARRPAHYLAIPPSLFATVIQGLGAAGLADGARVIVEKPFGRDLASARELNRVAHVGVPGRLDLPHRSLPREGGDHEHPLLPLRQFLPGADLEPQLRGQRPGHPVRGLRRGERGAFYESAGCLRDVIQNHLFQIVALLAMEPPAYRGFGAVHSEKAKVFQAMRPLTPDDVVRGQYAGYRKEPNVAKGVGRRDLLRPAALHRLVAVAGSAVVPALGQVPGRPRRPRSWWS